MLVLRRRLVARPSSLRRGRDVGATLAASITTHTGPWPRTNSAIHMDGSRGRGEAMTATAAAAHARGGANPARYFSGIAVAATSATQEQPNGPNSSELQDEYRDAGHPGARSGTYHVPRPFVLENGGVLHDVQVAYTTYGTLNAQRDNAIVLCHALTGHSLVHQWWDTIVSPAWTDKYFLVCANILGSCYGTTGPTSVDPATGRAYGPTFPAVTVRDAVRLQRQLVEEELGVRQVRSVIGGSLGGMQTLEWAFIGGPDFVRSIIPIASNSHHTAWQIGVSEVQRQAIAMDPAFRGGHYDPIAPPRQGLAVARQIAMISYRTHAAYKEKYGRQEVNEDAARQQQQQQQQDPAHRHPRYLVQSYLEYQGQKFLSRFDANAYVTLTHLMDTHDVGRGRGGVARALSTLDQPALVVGVESDVLYPLAEQHELAEMLPRAAFHALASPHGHDGFLLEQDTISALAADFLERHVN